MSKVFYDHLVIFEEIEVVLKRHQLDLKDHVEVREMIEETVHFRVLNRILTHLPKEHHQEFLEKFHQAPYSENLLTFLKEKVEKIEEFIKDEIETLKKELLDDLQIASK